MQPVKFVEYTAAGAVAGAAFTGLGATILHPIAPDSFERRGAAVAGLIGGATTHAVYGLLSAFDGEPGLGHHLRHLGRSLPLAALTSGVIGGALLGLGGYHDHPAPDALIVSGLLGGAVIGAAALVGTAGAFLCCQRRPAWTRLAHGDLGLGERLNEGSSEP